jgi:hypothetical protein
MATAARPEGDSDSGETRRRRQRRGQGRTVKPEGDDDGGVTREMARPEKDSDSESEPRTGG